MKRRALSEGQFPLFSSSLSFSRSRLTAGDLGLLSDGGAGADSGVGGGIPDAGVCGIADAGVLLPAPRPAAADTGGVRGLAERGVRVFSRSGAAESGVRARSGAAEIGVRIRLGAAECGVRGGAAETGVRVLSRGGRSKETERAEVWPTAAVMLL